MTPESDLDMPPVATTMEEKGAEVFSLEHPQLAVLGKLQDAGLDKGMRSASTIVVSAFFAGAYICFGGAVYVQSLGAVGSPVLSAFLFPAGLSFVVSTGCDLLTSNMMYALLPILLNDRRRSMRYKWVNLGRLLALSLLGNLAACLLLAWASVSLDLLDPRQLAVIGSKKTSSPARAVFLKAIGANWLVNLAVFQTSLTSSFPAKLAMLWLPIASFVLLGLEHVVANLFFIPAAAISSSDIRLLDGVVSNILPCLCGNFVGAAFFTYGQSVLSGAQLPHGRKAQHVA